jgi:hypothetical protein
MWEETKNSHICYGHNVEKETGVCVFNPLFEKNMVPNTLYMSSHLISYHMKQNQYRKDIEGVLEWKYGEEHKAKQNQSNHSRHATKTQYKH